MLSIFTSFFQAICNATCFPRKTYYIWFLVHLTYYYLYFVVFFSQPQDLAHGGLLTNLFVQHNLQFLYTISQLQGFSSMHVYKLKNMRKFKPDPIIITYLLLNSQTMMFRTFTRSNGKSYLGQCNYLVETQAQKLESQLETGHVFTHIQYYP